MRALGAKHWPYRSSTSNESLSGGTDLHGALRTFFPALTNAQLATYDQVYAPQNFASDAQRFTVATGESELICAVRALRSVYCRKED